MPTPIGTTCRAPWRPARSWSAARAAGPETVPTAESHACASIAYLGWQRATEALAEAAAALAKDPASLRREGRRGTRVRARARSPQSRGGLPRGHRACRTDGEEAHVGLGRCCAQGRRQDEASPSSGARCSSTANDPEPSTSSAMRSRPPRPRASACSSTRRASALVRRRVAGARHPAARRRQHGRGARRAARARRNAPIRRARPLVLLGQGGAGATNAPTTRSMPGEAALKIVRNNAARAKLLVADGAREEGRDRPRARGVPGRVGPRPRRPVAARARERGVPRRRARHERARLRRQGRAGVPRTGRPAGPRSATRSSAQGDEGRARRLPEGARRPDGPVDRAAVAAEAGGASVSGADVSPADLVAAARPRGRTPRGRARDARWSTTRRPATSSCSRPSGPTPARRGCSGSRATRARASRRSCDRLIEAYRARGHARRRRRRRPDEPLLGRAPSSATASAWRVTRPTTGVFIRSLATRGHLGGLSRSARDVVRVLDACGLRRRPRRDRGRRAGRARDHAHRALDARRDGARHGRRGAGHQGGHPRVRRRLRRQQGRPRRARTRPCATSS